GNGQREPEKWKTENVADHLGRVDPIDRIEEDALEVGGRVGPQRRPHPCHRQRQTADQKQPRFAVGDHDRYGSRPMPCREMPCAGSTSCCNAYMHAAASSILRTNAIEP